MEKLVLPDRIELSTSPLPMEFLYHIDKHHVFLIAIEASPDFPLRELPALLDYGTTSA
jgi:hypothetical protein